MRGPGSDLFDFMVNILVDFLKTNNLLEEATVDNPYHLGFTFSFPTEQQSLAKAKLCKWTKGYTCEGVEGVDIGLLLKKAIAKRPELHVEVSLFSFITIKRGINLIRYLQLFDLLINSSLVSLGQCNSE